MPSQYTKWSKTKAAILYLMLGDNFLKDQDPKEKKKAKESKPKKNIKEDFAKQLSLFDL